MDNIAIVVMSCDSYSDLWDGFFETKERFWKDCPFNTYLVTNNKQCDLKHAVSIKCGDEFNWVGRLRECLKTIKEDTIILMLEDYYISNYVDQKEVESLVDFLSQENVSYCKLETRGTKFPKKYKKDYIRLITPDIRYGMSLITSVWKKSFLLDVLGEDDYTAWEFEIRRNMADDTSKTTDKLCLCDIRNILNISHMVQRGKYLRSGLRFLKKQKVIIDYSKRGRINIFTEMYISLVDAVKNNKIVRKLLLGLFKIFHIKTISMKYEEEIRNKKYK